MGSHSTTMRFVPVKGAEQLGILVLHRTRELPRDYPMVAPNYSAKRSEFAKKIGLGRTKSRAAPKRRKRA